MKQFATNNDGQPVIFLVQHGESSMGVYRTAPCATLKKAMAVAEGWMKGEDGWRHTQGLEGDGAIRSAWEKSCDYIEVIEQVVL